MKWKKWITCCWRETVTSGQILQNVSTSGLLEKKKSCARREAPHKNKEPEVISHRALALVKSRKSLWKFPYWAVKVTEAKRSAKAAHLFLSSNILKALLFCVSSRIATLLEQSPKYPLATAPEQRKGRKLEKHCWLPINPIQCYKLITISHSHAEMH